MDINQKLLAAFQVEHIEHLEGIRACLARWEQCGELTDVDEAFRRAHSLKGAARITGFTPVEALAHRLESLFSRLRAKTLTANQAIVQVIHAALDAIEDAAACLLVGRAAADSGAVVGQLDALSNSGVQAEKSAANGAAAIDVTIPAAAVAPLAAIETVRLNAESLDRLLQSTGRLLTENMRQDALGRELAGMNGRLTEIQREWNSLQRTAAGALRRLGDIPEFAAVGRFLDFSEREMQSLTRQMRAMRTFQKQSSWSVKQLAEKLQADVRQARMIPAESEFQGFRKMLRELARDEGKEIDFHIAGLETLADRLVLQSLKDPLMHVLRNAVSHGIDSPAQRKQRGRPALGRVTLSLQTIGNRLTIEVTDDGPGLDFSRIAETAVRRKLLSEAEVASRSPQEIARLLFQTGFSTAAKITEISGRGMGLSIVYDTVTRLQGEVEILPLATGGTLLRIAAPLSISTHRLLLVQAEGQTFALPTYGIEGLHRVQVQDLESVEGRPMLLIAGQLTPLASLSQLLHGAADARIAADLLFLVVLRSGAKRLAVAVDALLDERNSLIKPLGAPADKLPLYLGGILLEDGAVCLTLNPAELVERFQPSAHAIAFQVGQPAEAWRPPTILVVDDSFTTRTLETSILETNGYTVRVAVDGLEALDLLRMEKFDLVITDVQMPRLDGFGLLEAMKREPRLARIPVIVVSSIDKREEQERGLHLGADAYIVKRKFDHQELLQVIQQIL